MALSEIDHVSGEMADCIASCFAAVQACECVATSVLSTTTANSVQRSFPSAPTPVVR